MNPFDGTKLCAEGRLERRCLEKLTVVNCSGEATDASAWVSISLHFPLRPVSLPQRGRGSLLCLLSHHSLHDDTLYRNAIHGLRINIKIDEPVQSVRSIYSLHSRRLSGGHCCCVNHPIRCGQDSFADERTQPRSRGQERAWTFPCRRHHSTTIRMVGFLSRNQAAHYHDDAEHGDMLDVV